MLGENFIPVIIALRIFEVRDFMLCNLLENFRLCSTHDLLGHTLVREAQIAAVLALKLKFACILF
jgi:hypothetical protein